MLHPNTYTILHYYHNNMNDRVLLLNLNTIEISYRRLLPYH
jgi:hypothetical protein